MTKYVNEYKEIFKSIGIDYRDINVDKLLSVLPQIICVDNIEYKFYISRNDSMIETGYLNSKNGFIFDNEDSSLLFSLVSTISEMYRKNPELIIKLKRDYWYYQLKVVDCRDKEILKNIYNILKDKISDKNEEFGNGKMYIDHCTILHVNDVNKSVEQSLELMMSAFGDVYVDLNINAIGTHSFNNGRIFAFRCSFNSKKPFYELFGRIPHITIATFGDCKPFDSNSIKDDEWYDINNITIRCKLSKFINGIEE